jgi:hypothetical protein
MDREQRGGQAGRDPQADSFDEHHDSYAWNAGARRAGDGADVEPEPPAAAAAFPWPPPENGSPVEHLMTTWQESVFRPAAFFASMPRKPALGGPLIYYLIFGMIGASIRLFWRMVLGDTMPDDASPLAQALRAGEAAGSPLVDFLLTPVMLLVGLGLAVVFIHATLWLTGGARHGLRTTSGVFAYTSGPQVFTVVPFLGAVVAGFWMLAMLIVGLREAHETTTWRAAIAVLLPLAAMMVLMLLVMLAMMAAGVPMLPDLMG